MVDTKRREFLTDCCKAIAGIALAPSFGQAAPSMQPERRHLGFPDASRHLRGDSSIAAAARAFALPPANLDSYRSSSRPLPRLTLDGVVGEARGRLTRVVPPARHPLAARYRDLRRHFLFEYYPWYRTDPWEHWDQFDRLPPVDSATTMMPLLGAYSSIDSRVVEQHARWMAEAGVGAINYSWWGRDSSTNDAVHLVMDVMRAHDIHVAFHIEPYANDRSAHFAEDVRYLLHEYGERRRWDCFLLLERADGTSSPVFKVFRSILPETVTDCLGRVTPVPDYTTDARWRQQIAALKAHFASDFDITVLADSLNRGRTVDGGFDGIAIYDNFVTPDLWPGLTAAFDEADLLVSFNVHAGFDAIEPRGPQGPCYTPLPFAPPVGPVDWSEPADRERVAVANDERIRQSFETTTALQASDRYANWRQGFFLVYINSFNEWHEGSSFEPAKPWADLTAAERAVGYRNPTDGYRRLRTLQSLLKPFIQ